MTDDLGLEHINFLKDKYSIISKTGEGTFSNVYKAINLSTDKVCALKVITKTSAPTRVVEELTLLMKLCGRNNCVPLLSIHRHEDQIVAEFPYCEFTEFRSFISFRTEYQTRHYMFNLLTALVNVHENGIIHRDIKPGNFLYNADNNRGVLIDFGLAQSEDKNKKINEPECNKIKNNPVIFFNSVVKRKNPPGYYEKDSRPHLKAPRAGTRGFRAPEVLLKYKHQTTAIDIWSAGVILLSIMSQQYPFFYSSDDYDALVEIATVFGHREMRNVAKHYGRVWKSNIETIPEEKIPFETLVSKLCDINFWSQSAFDLLKKMLDLYSDRRITAKEALQHTFFDSLRNK